LIFARVGLIMFALSVLGSSTTTLYAQGVEESSPKSSRVQSTRLDIIERQLELVLENQKMILEGQEKLSGEHKQMKIWIHRK